MTKTIKVTCQECSKDFEYEVKRGPRKKFCPDCNEVKRQERLNSFLDKMREKKNKGGIWPFKG
jgi:hypothetical protein